MNVGYMPNKAARIMTVLSNSKIPMSAMEIAKQLPSRQFTSRDTGNILCALEADGKVRKVKKGFDNYWEVV